jgi:hypothetical protein
MSRPTSSASPDSAPRAAVNVAAALQGESALGGLLERVRQSQARLACIAALLPSGLREGVRAGPLDDAAWTLLVASNAGAAKLRQMLPALQSALTAAGFGPPHVIQVKVRPKA